jgi:hypothetical protein
VRAGSAIALIVLLSSAPTAFPKELLVGTVRTGNDTELAFSISGRSRRDVVGGQLVLGETPYEISQTSLHSLVGARRFVSAGAGSFAEFVIFSSSYSDQTAVGRPWVAAREVWHCDEPYNSFVAVYRVEGEEAVKALGPIPYPKLADEVELSQRSRVYCFTGLLPAGE